MALLPSQDSVYGKRDGVISGWAITHKDEKNRLRASQGWKTGVVLNVKMLPRGEMFKPETVPWMFSLFFRINLHHRVRVGWT